VLWREYNMAAAALNRLPQWVVYWSVVSVLVGESALRAERALCGLMAAHSLLHSSAPGMRCSSSCGRRRWLRKASLPFGHHVRDRDDLHQ
jgi:hypothetical protein